MDGLARAALLAEAAANQVPFSSTVIMASAWSAARRIESGPETAIPTGGAWSGRSYSFALDLEVPALVADVLAGEELPDDLDGFLQAFVADPRCRPTGPR